MVKIEIATTSNVDKDATKLNLDTTSRNVK